MAVGVQAPSGQNVLPGPAASVLLVDAALPGPLDPAFFLVGVDLGAFEQLADPRPVAFDMAGLWAPGEDLAVHNRIHVIPRRRDLGAVVSLQTIEVEVWNAFLTRAKTLTDINLEGPTGVTVIDDLGLPAHFPASESHLYVVEVSADGDPQIDNLITWVFTGVDELGTNLRLLGFRLIPYPIPPNMAQPVMERFGYLTDVLTAFNGNEQRVQLKAVPTGSIGYSVLLDSLQEAQLVNALMYGNRHRSWGVGRWMFQTKLLATALADGTTVMCDTTNLVFEVGNLVMLWRDPFTWEAQRIEEVQADRLILSLGLRSTWPAIQTAVVPIVIGRIEADPEVVWESLKVVSQAINFTVDGFHP